LRGTPGSFARKSEILLRQAEVDLEHGCYEKCVSACYFAAECALNAFSLMKQGNLPRGYRSRLALIGRWFPHLLRDYDSLHRIRVRADHWDDLIEEEEARKSLESSRRLVKEILDALK